MVVNWQTPETKAALLDAILGSGLFHLSNKAALEKILDAWPKSKGLPPTFEGLKQHLGKRRRGSTGASVARTPGTVPARRGVAITVTKANKGKGNSSKPQVEDESEDDEVNETPAPVAIRTSATVTPKRGVAVRITKANKGGSGSGTNTRPVHVEDESEDDDFDMTPTPAIRKSATVTPKRGVAVRITKASNGNGGSNNNYRPVHIENESEDDESNTTPTPKPSLLRNEHTLRPSQKTPQDARRPAANLPPFHPARGITRPASTTLSPPTRQSPSKATQVRVSPPTPPQNRNASLANSPLFRGPTFKPRPKVAPIWPPAHLKSTSPPQNRPSPPKGPQIDKTNMHLLPIFSCAAPRQTPPKSPQVVRLPSAKLSPATGLLTPPTAVNGKRKRKEHTTVLPEMETCKPFKKVKQEVIVIADDNDNKNEADLESLTMAQHALFMRKKRAEEDRRKYGFESLKCST